jgi:hypothetical protein
MSRRVLPVVVSICAALAAPCGRAQAPAPAAPPAKEAPAGAAGPGEPAPLTDAEAKEAQKAGDEFLRRATVCIGSIAGEDYYAAVADKTIIGVGRTRMAVEKFGGVPAYLREDEFHLRGPKGEAIHNTAETRLTSDFRPLLVKMQRTLRGKDGKTLQIRDSLVFAGGTYVREAESPGRKPQRHQFGAPAEAFVGSLDVVVRLLDPTAKKTFLFREMDPQSGKLHRRRVDVKGEEEAGNGMKIRRIEVDGGRSGIFLFSAEGKMEGYGRRDAPFQFSRITPEAFQELLAKFAPGEANPRKN